MKVLKLMWSKLRGRWRKFSRQERIVLTLANLFFIFWAVYVMFPYVFTLMNSFKKTALYYDDMFGFPTEWMWSNYVKAINVEYAGTSVLGMLINNFLYAFTFSMGTCLCSTCTAYTLARFDFGLKKFLYTMAITVQLIPIFGTTGAGYRLVYNLHLDNNFLITWMIGAGGFDMIFIIMHSYFLTMNREYAEAAQIDGASQLVIFYKIMLPLAVSPFLAQFLGNFLGYWNDYLGPRLYMPKYPTLAVGIYALKDSTKYMGGITIYLAAIMLACIPTLIIFLCFHKKILNVDFGGGIKM